MEIFSFFLVERLKATFSFWVENLKEIFSSFLVGNWRAIFFF